MTFRNTHTLGRRTIVTTGHKRHVCKCCYLSDRVEAKESNKNESNAAINSPIARAAHYPALLTHAKAHVAPIRHSGAQPADSERGAGRLTFTCKMNVTLWMYVCVCACLYALGFALVVPPAITKPRTLCSLGRSAEIATVVIVCRWTRARSHAQRAKHTGKQTPLA